MPSTASCRRRSCSLMNSSCGTEWMSWFCSLASSMAFRSWRESPSLKQENHLEVETMDLLGALE